MFRQVWTVRCKGGLSSAGVHRLPSSVWTSRNIRIRVSIIIIIAGGAVVINHSSYIVFPNHHQPLGHGWTSFVVEELRPDSLIVLLTLSELKIAPTHKMWPWSVLHVAVCLNIILIFL